MKGYNSERRVFFNSLISKFEEAKYKKDEISMLPMDISISSNPKLLTQDPSLLSKLTKIHLVSLKGELIETILNHMVSTDTTGHLYESIVGNSIELLAEERVNLKDFFRSKQAYLKVNTEKGKFEEELIINKPLFISNDESIEVVLKNFNENI